MDGLVEGRRFLQQARNGEGAEQQQKAAENDRGEPLVATRVSGRLTDARRRLRLATRSRGCPTLVRTGHGLVGLTGPA
jgi:hypothetical protein